MNKLKNKLSFKLFYNDKFVMFFSILVAFISWIYVASTTQESTIFTVTDISINLPELTNDMRYFSGADVKAEVKISGNALVVTNVTKDDIYITAADVSFINQPGEYTIDLVPKKSGVKTDYSFESSVSPSSLKVFVDRYDEGRVMQITDKITVNSVAPSCYASQTVLSRQSVKISGAESIVNSIAEVDAEYTFENTLSETTVVKAPLVFYDSSGKKISSKYINADISEVDATVPILDVKHVQIIPKITNIPELLDLDSSVIQVEPSTIELAMDKKSSTTSVSTSAIDFTKVTKQNSRFVVDIEIPSGCKNINSIEKADVIFDLSGMTEKNITLQQSNFVIENQGENQTATVANKSLPVLVIGPSQKINLLTQVSVVARIDMSDKSTVTEGYVERPVKIEFKDPFTQCWVEGTYTVNVKLSPKNVTPEESSGG
ncbi:MAG: hypothetical protein IJU51_00400 [Clostridia bacterium]|nr:hypothetical protein [Clostridia bacterium]